MNPPGTFDLLASIRDARGVPFPISARSTWSDEEIRAAGEAFYGRQLPGAVERGPSTSPQSLAREDAAIARAEARS